LFDMADGKKNKLTARGFRAMKADGRAVVALSVYDAPTAGFAEARGVDLLLVGDSLGMAVLGYESTIPVTIEESLHHCGAVRRGAPNTFVVGDMPFMTYQTSPVDAMRNAARYLQDVGCDAVKVEGGREMAETVARMVGAGIPVLGHVGLLPQKVLTSGGYRRAGTTDEDANRVLADAKAVEAAGAFAVVLEGIPSALAAEISSALDIPTIGIGAGPGCDGQIQVVSDILGLLSFTPKHAKRYVDLDAVIQDAFSRYIDDVRSKRFPE